MARVQVATVLALLLVGCGAPGSVTLSNEGTDPADDDESSSESPATSERGVPPRESFSEEQITALTRVLEDARLIGEGIMLDTSRIEQLNDSRSYDGSPVDLYLQEVTALWMATDWVGVYDTAAQVVSIPAWRHQENSAEFDWRDESWKSRPAGRPSNGSPPVEDAPAPDESP